MRREAGEQRGYVVLAVVGLSSFQTAMSLSIIFVVFPDLADSYPETSAASLSWVVTSFTIVGASTLVVGSAIGERMGRTRTVMAGTAIFTLASAVAAVAPNVPVLVAARAAQAIGASLTLPSGAAIVMDAFPTAQRGNAIATWSAIGAVAAAMGPSVGGFLVDAGGWRWAFWLNLPVGVVALAAQRLVLVHDRPTHRPPLPDGVGVLVLLGGVSALVLGLVQSDDWGWADARTLGSLAVGAALVGLLAVRCRTHPRPVVDPALVRHRSYTLGNLAILLFSTSFFGYQFAAVLFLTEAWGYSIREAGLLVTPVFLLTGVMSVVAGRVGARGGYPANVVVGTVLWAGALVGLAVAVDDERAVGTWLVSATVAGLGSGLLWGSLFGIIVRDLDTEQLSLGASVNQTLQRLGNALGVAIGVTVLGTVASGTVGSFPRVFAVQGAFAAVGAVAALVATRPRPLPQRASAQTTSVR
jgi:EmrB/QacA subfamily drug resistance transporter